MPGLWHWYCCYHPCTACTKATDQDERQAVINGLLSDCCMASQIQGFDPPYGRKFSLVGVNGTHTITRDPEYPCIWTATIPGGLRIDYMLNYDCTPETPAWTEYADVVIYHQLSTIWVYAYWVDTHTSMAYTAFLFYGVPEIEDRNCDVEIENVLTACDQLSSAYGYGGTITIGPVP